MNKLEYTLELANNEVNRTSYAEGYDKLSILLSQQEDTLVPQESLLNEIDKFLIFGNKYKVTIEELS